MRIAVGIAVLMVMAQAASAAPHRGNPSDPPDTRAESFPITDADVDRVTHAGHPHHTYADDVADRFGVKNGQAVLFRSDDYDQTTNRGLSLGVNSQGAGLSLRW